MTELNTISKKTQSSGEDVRLDARLGLAKRSLQNSKQ
jgi:hypothetical protein